jgi:hypothetical protein
MSRVLLVLGVLAGFCGEVSAALAANGTAQAVKPDATAALKQDVRELVVGSDVSIGETVTTSDHGLVQLLFTDGTKLAIGPSSTLKLEDYLVRNNNTAGKFAINTLAGTFRFVTGNAPKDDYEIRTPTGTIGVRGTVFEWTISSLVPDLVPPSQRSTLVLVLEGAVRLCNLAGSCADVGDLCDFGWFNAAGAGGIDNTRESRAAFRSFFPIDSNPSVLRFNYRVENDRDCLFAPPSSTPLPPTAGRSDNEQQQQAEPTTEPTTEPTIEPTTEPTVPIIPPPSPTGSP